jgi:Septum formation
MKRIAGWVLLAFLAGACGGVFTLEVGTCFDDQESTEISSVPEVECSQPHDNEVFALIDYADTDVYPGTDQMNDIGTELCIEQFDEYVGLAYLDSELEVFAITPTQSSWDNDNDREIICALFNLDFSKLTGSMQGAAR